MSERAMEAVRRIVGDRRVRLLALAGLLLLAVWVLWQLRVAYRGLYMLFFVRHPALTSIPLLAGGFAFIIHLLIARVTGRRSTPASRPPAARKPQPDPSASYRISNKSSLSEGVIRLSKQETAAPEREQAAAPGQSSPVARRPRKPRRAAGDSEPAPKEASAPATGRRARAALADLARGGSRGGWRRLRAHLARPFRSFLIFGGLGFLVAALVTSPLTGAAIYDHTRYGELELDTLRGGEVRIKPYEVARRQTENGLNSPTERPTNLHMVKVDGRLTWTSVRDPEGLVRVFTKSTKGVMSVDAARTAPAVRQSGPRYDADFRFGPGMRITDNIRWQLYKKKCYSCDVAELTGLPTPDGPLVIAPYIRYKGNWFVRRPTFGGVYLVHADGRIDDLSPAEAARNPLLRGAGRIFPEKLARRIADAYKYKRGIWNRMFIHTEQLEVADTDENRQPFLQSFAGLGAQWVTTLKPRGRTFTTAALMTTDATSGQTRLWLAPKGRALIGNERALDIVRGESFPGIVFAREDAADAEGKFRVVEPRQVFPAGRLQFLVSIIPNAANRVTMSVVVDAESQRVVGKFPATPEGDEDLITYLRTGELDPEGAGEDPVTDEREPAGEETDATSTLRRLLEENRIEQRRAAGRIADLKAQERDLLRLLRAAERAR